MSGRRMDEGEEPLEKIGKGTRLQSYSDRLGRKPKKKTRASIDNRVIVVLRLPIRLALQTERDRVDPEMNLSKFIREFVVAEWLTDRGYTAKDMERTALKHVLAEEAARLDAEEHGEGTPRYALEA